MTILLTFLLWNAFRLSRPHTMDVSQMHLQF